MTRSRKKPIVVLTSKIDKDTAHKQVRRRVKAELSKPEPDEILIEADTTDLGLDDWGTKFDFRYTDPGEYFPTEETIKKASRK